MFKILTLLFCTAKLFSQTGKIAEEVIRLQNERTYFQKIDVFKRNFNPKNLQHLQATDSATIISLDKTKLQEIVLQKKQFLSLEIPYNNETIEVLLYKVNIQAEGYEVKSDAKNLQSIKFQDGLHYRGIINGNNNSLVSFNFYENEVSAIISSSKHNNIVVGKLQYENNQDDYVVYSDNNLKILNNFECASIDDIDTSLKSNNQKTSNVLGTLSNRCVSLYFELGYSVYQANGNNLTQCNVWMNSQFNFIKTIYENDGISIALKSIYIWTTPDPYSGTSSNANLNLFKQNRPFFNGDLGMLLIIGNGLGGVANAINGLCKETNYSFSDINISYASLPLFSWNINVIAHEFGHLLGSQHTHGCFWNNNNTAIDGCGPTFNISLKEGSCAVGPLPTTTKGTIMSYCHMLSNVGINFANGFGDQPRARIIQTINASKCLSADCINTCINQINNITLASVTNSSAQITWNDANSSNIEWEYFNTTNPNLVPTNWNTVNTKSIIFDNLLANTFYTIFIRPKCPTADGVYKKMTFSTIDNYCQGSTFSDTGGFNYNYADFENWTRVISPDVPVNKIKIDFVQFDTELNYDFLYIYNGNSTSAPLLTPSGLSGNNISQTSFISTDSTGALTFSFKSDQVVNSIGWKANIACNSIVGGLNTSEQNYLDYSYFPNPVTNLLNIKANSLIENAKIYTIDGRLILNSKVNLLEKSFDMSNFAIGTYLVNLIIDDKSVTFKIQKN